MSEQQNERKQRTTKERCYLTEAFWACIVVGIIESIWPNATPFTFWGLWTPNGTVAQWLYAAWPIFAWGAGVTAWRAFTTYNKPEENRHAEHILAGGFVISLWAGVMEEICFRWLIFLNAIIGALVANYLFFGWLGFGIGEWLQLHLVGPVANFFTMGELSRYLVNPEMWTVGAGMIAANAFFRDGHKYQGALGWINSWFLGMYFFYMMLTFGLPAAILVHFLYDMLIFTVVYIDRAIERASGRA
jgi:hypothetical protein